MSGASDKILWLFSKRTAWTNVDAAKELGLPLSDINHEVGVMQSHGCLSLLTIDYASGVSYLNLSEKGNKALAALRASYQSRDALDI